MKKPLKVTLIGILSFLILYLGITFITKDKSELSCMFTFGKYKNKIVCEGPPKEPMGKIYYMGVDNCKSLANEYICLGGIFDPTKSKKATTFK